MKKYVYLLIVFVFVSLALQFNAASASLDSAEGANAQAEPNRAVYQPLPEDAIPGTIPPLVGGKKATRPIVISRGPSGTLNSELSPTAPTINVWYGSNQTFGSKGNPQQWVNVLGNVTGPAPINTLTYTLNGGPEKALSMGPDYLRLAEEGDFNIEIDYSTLNDGNNTVVIKAVDSETNEVTENVTVNYQAGITWPENDTVDWSSSDNLQEIAQIVDGQWIVDGGQLHALTFDYDRLVAIGDETWVDYEVSFPMTVHGVDDSGNTGNSNGPGVGMILRWLGHVNEDGEQPNIGWQRLGALAWYRWAPSGLEALELRGYNSTIGSNSDIELEFDLTYMLKASVQTVPDEGSYYRVKLWPANETEPVAWNLEGYGPGDEPTNGSIALVAHHVDVHFGNVVVERLQDIRLGVNTTVNGNGELLLVPEQPVDGYAYSDRVVVYAFPDEGFVFTGWSGDVTGNDNPLAFNITQDMNVTANFEVAPPSSLTVDIEGQGDVTLDPDQAVYDYGEIVTLTAVPDDGYFFWGWDGSQGDLSGLENPTTLLMDGDKTVTAVFIPQTDASPASDDFSQCTLNTNLWAFTNPLGDGSLSWTGGAAIFDVPAGTSHNMWQGDMNAPRIMQPTLNQDFEIEVKFDSIPEEKFQLQGVLIQNDADNWLRFDFYHDGSKLRVHAAQMVNGAAGTLDISPLDPGTSESLYLRVKRNGNQWTQYHSLDGADWSTSAQFNSAMEVTSTGVFVGNASNPSGSEPAFTGVVDYFFNTGAPIVPQNDGPKSLSVSVASGQGTVQVTPNQSSYECGDVVTLNANPADGWRFGGWGGDLSGAANPTQLTIIKNHLVTASFFEGNVGVFLPIIKKP